MRQPHFLWNAKHNTIKLLVLILLSAEITALGNVEVAQAAIPVTLQVQEDQLDSTNVQVSKDGTTNLMIQLSSRFDNVEVYRIARSRWENDKNNPSGGSYVGPIWESSFHLQGVKSSYVEETGDEFPSTLEELRGEESAKQNVFAAWVYSHLEDLALKGSEADLSESVSFYDEADVTSTTVKVSEAPYGVYLIHVNESNALVYAYPTLSTTTGFWYMKNNVIVNLKFYALDPSENLYKTREAAFSFQEEGLTNLSGATGEVVWVRDACDVPVFPYLPDFTFVMEGTKGTGLNDLTGISAMICQTSGSEDIQNLAKDAYTALYSTGVDRQVIDGSAEGLYTYVDQAGRPNLLCQVAVQDGTSHATWYAYDYASHRLTLLGECGENAPQDFWDETIGQAYMEAVADAELTEGFTWAAEDQWMREIRNVTFDYEKLIAYQVKKVGVIYGLTISDEAVVGNNAEMLSKNANRVRFYVDGDFSRNIDSYEAGTQVTTYGIALSVLDGENGLAPQGGAVFKLYKSKAENPTRHGIEGSADWNCLGTVEVDTVTGKAQITGLGTGTYALIEEKAPGKYRVATDATIVTIDETGRGVNDGFATVKVTNYRKLNVHLVHSGKVILLPFFGILLMGVTMIVTFFKQNSLKRYC